jgi:hypothetical protein
LYPIVHQYPNVCHLSLIVWTGWWFSIGFTYLVDLWVLCKSLVLRYIRVLRTSLVAIGSITESIMLPNKKKNPTNFLIEFLAEREVTRPDLLSLRYSTNWLLQPNKQSQYRQLLVSPKPPKSIEPEHPMKPRFTLIPPYPCYITNIQCGSPFIMADDVRDFGFDNIPQPCKH